MSLVRAPSLTATELAICSPACCIVRKPRIDRLSSDKSCQEMGMGLQT